MKQGSASVLPDGELRRSARLPRAGRRRVVFSAGGGRHPGNVPLAPSAATVFDWQRVDNPGERERTANYLKRGCAVSITGVGLLLAAPSERTARRARRWWSLSATMVRRLNAARRPLLRVGSPRAVLVHGPAFKTAREREDGIDSWTSADHPRAPPGAITAAQAARAVVAAVLQRSDRCSGALPAAEFHFHGAASFIRVVRSATTGTS